MEPVFQSHKYQNYVHQAQEFTHRMNTSSSSTSNSGGEASTSVVIIFESMTKNQCYPYYHPRGYVCPSTVSSPSPSGHHHTQESGEVFSTLHRRDITFSSLQSTTDEDLQFGAVLEGLDRWPVVFHVPAEEEEESAHSIPHWRTTVVSLLMDPQVNVGYTSDSAYVDKRSNRTIFLVRLGAQLTLGVIVENRQRKAKDKFVHEFLTSVVSGLEHHAVFEGSVSE